MEMAMSDKVNDIVKRIPISTCCNKCEVYATCEGKEVLNMNEELRSCGVRDGSTVQTTSKMRGGGKHRDKQSKVEGAEWKPEEDRAGARTESGV